MAECIPKLLVSEYVLQLSDLCLCHQISAYTQVQTANWDLFPFKKGAGGKGEEKKKIKKGKKERKKKNRFRQTGERSTIEGPIHTPPHPPLLSLDCGMKKQWLFWGTVQTRQLWKN